MRPDDTTDARYGGQVAGNTIDLMAALTTGGPMAERDEKTGRFLPGNSGCGGGRPPGNSIESNRKLLLEYLGPEKIRKLVDKLYSLATDDGDVKACAYLLDQAIGKALQSVQLASQVEHISPEQRRRDLSRRLKELGFDSR